MAYVLCCTETPAHLQVAAAFLLNPLSVLACVAQSTQAIRDPPFPLVRTQLDAKLDEIRIIAEQRGAQRAVARMYKLSCSHTVGCGGWITFSYPCCCCSRCKDAGVVPPQFSLSQPISLRTTWLNPLHTL
jgi:hypothetical protein